MFAEVKWLVELTAWTSGATPLTTPQ